MRVKKKSGTVRNIINEWKKGVDDSDYKSIRELAVMNKAIFLVPVIACRFAGAAASVTVQQGQALTSGKNTIKTHTPINLDTLKKATEMII